MNALEYLIDQHREIRSLFDQFETAARVRPKVRLLRKLVDLLAVHEAIEEMFLAQIAAADELLPRALERHLSAEQIVGEILGAGAESHEAAAWVFILRECMTQHAEEEEDELFPRVRELLTDEQLELVGVRMARVADQLLEPGAGARERITARRAQA